LEVTPLFKKKVKHARRYQEIISAIIRNGFGYLINDFGLAEVLSISPKKVDASTNSNRRPVGERIRRLLQDLGPTFIKLGQMASLRRDLIPVTIIAELEKLQDQVPPFSFNQVQQLIEEEFGTKLKELFAEFDQEPLATASIGQVHKAKLHTQEWVAVKVQKPNIRANIETDLEILEDIAVLLETHFDWAKQYQLREIINEFAQALLAELDYYNEGRNAERISKQFTNDDTVHIPKIYWDYSTKKILTMEFIVGKKINQFLDEEIVGYDKKLISERLIYSLFRQIFIEGFFHGDPHPGNLVILSGNIIAYMDFGMVGRLTEDAKHHCASLVIGLMRGDTDNIIKSVDHLATIPDDIDMKMLHADIDQLREKYYDVPFSQLSLKDAINDLFQIAFKYHIHFPPDLTILAKSLMTIEGVIEALAPDFSIIECAKPIGEQLLKDRYHPKKIVKQGWKKFLDQLDIAFQIPKNLRDISAIMRKGKFRLEISIPDIHLFLIKLDRISNRLSFAIVLLAFSMMMTGLIIGTSITGQSSILWKNPIIEIGFGVATLMLLWLLFSIFKSGKF